ncbi:MAG: ribosome maturation factor RimM [Pseudomonadales bacterium]
MPADQRSGDAARAAWLVVGRLNGSFGVRGWLKLESFTEPVDNIFAYQPWRVSAASVGGLVRSKRGEQGLPAVVQIEDRENHGNEFVVKLAGVDSKEAAARFAGLLIEVPRACLPENEAGDYYWHQLEGLEVYQVDTAGAAGEKLGRVDHLLATGANDVLVVRGDIKAGAGGSKASEILIPYLPDTVVLAVDLDQGRMLVDWQNE